MKKELFNIIFLGVIVFVVAWLYWPKEETVGLREPIGYKSYILALSWQPAFCEGKPNKPECRSQHKLRYDASNFSLHGLWPQPRDNVYCGVSKDIVETDKRGRWNELPKLEIQGRLRKELARRMPGYRSNLHRHEWYKHGTCMTDDPQRYFEVSIDIIDEINKTLLRDLFAQNIGKEITATQIIKAMEHGFGKSAGKRITISCKRDGKRSIINEIRLSYGHKIGVGIIQEFAEDLRTSPKLPIGCKRGIVDPVGLQ